MTAELQDLSTFALVARHAGFRQAARANGQSASKMSEAVRRLEQQLGIRLLVRTTRSVMPTEAGALLLTRLQPALDEVASALDVLNDLRDKPRGTLRLNVPVSAARLFLPDMVNRFMTLYPDIVLELMVDNDFIDLAISAAIAGHGILYLFEEWLAPHLASGDLVPVLPDWWLSFPGPYLYYPGRRHLPAPLRAFIDFIRDEAPPAMITA
ncbi:MAG: LysR substrate-binding domain-containing protein [Pseudomonadota bacterium]|nr:LysR substrate-binding domain-containing protein [Pseudomonadota bacterium]